MGQPQLAPGSGMNLHDPAFAIAAREHQLPAGSQHLMAFLVTLGLLTGGTLAGCLGSKPPPPAPAPKVSGPKPLLDGWKPPKAVLVLSGEQFGYIEPCGCSLTQSGGLARRANLIAKMQEKGWAVAGLDVGDSLKRSRRQDQLKFDALLNGMKQLGYAAVAAGEAELRLPPDYLLSLFSENEGVTLGGLLVSANVTLFDSPELGVPKRFRVFKVGDVTIGVTSVLGADAAANVAPAGVQTNVSVQPAAEALAAVTAELVAQKPDVLILLAHGSVEEGVAWAKAFPQYQVVLTAGGPEDPDPKPQILGKTWVLQAGHKGKHVGVLGLDPTADSPYQWEIVDLDNVRFEHDPRMDAIMESYQQTLKDQDLLHTDPQLVIPHPQGGKFVGAAKCGECHRKAYARWKESKHAKAYASLEKGRKDYGGKWVSRVFDPECLSCHVTGWDPQEVQRYDTGFLSPEETPHLLGQQCENCHGPGQAHTDIEFAALKAPGSVPRDELIAARAAVKLNSATAEKLVCTKCHDYENSPNFKFQKYWDEVKHPWKD